MCYWQELTEGTSKNLWFKGALTLEQRLDSAPNQTCNLAQQTSNMTKEEDMLMNEKNTTDDLNWVVKPKLAFLAALHVLVLVLSLVVHPRAFRALP
jgi:hypothetical protein